MRFDFTDEDIKNELNKVYIEDDDVLLTGEYIEGEGKKYVLTGSALIEGETYHGFETEFELEDEIENPTAASLMSADWKWYDYICWK